MIKIWFGYLAQLLSGRIFNSIMDLGDRVRTLEGRVKEIITMTPNEQKLVNAAQTIVALAATFQTTFDAQQAKIKTLQEQAASNEAHAPEDLTEEFSKFDGAMEQLQSLAGTLTPASTDGVSVSDPATTPVEVAVPDEVRPADPMNPPPGSEGTFNAPLPDAAVTVPVDNQLNLPPGTEGQPEPIPAEVAPANPDEGQPVTEPQPATPAAETPETVPAETEAPKTDVPAPVVGDEGPVADGVDPNAPVKEEDDDDGWGPEPDKPGTPVG